MFEYLSTDMYNLLGYLCMWHPLLTFKIQQNHADICLDAYQIPCKNSALTWHLVFSSDVTVDSRVSLDPAHEVLVHRRVSLDDTLDG